MGGAIAQRVETAVSTGAALCFAGATGFAVAVAAQPLLDTPGPIALGAAAFCAAFPAARSLLRLCEGEPRPFTQPQFDIHSIEPARPDELLLTDADRLPAGDTDDALVLDDVLVAISPDSRVVQLFDPGAMPTPGQLQARIDRHLGGGTGSRAQPPDASEALFAALAELRRSLG